MDCAGLVVPTSWVANVRLAADKVALGPEVQLFFRGLLSGHSCYGLHARRVAIRPSTLKAPTASLPLLPFRLLPGGAKPVPGRDLHPLKSSAFHGALFRQRRRVGRKLCRQVV